MAPSANPSGGPARVEILCIGTELLSGKVNTHTAWLAGMLKSIGLSIARDTALPDSREEIAAAVRESLRRSDLVLLCGGLGPTFDDLTREGAADALGLKLLYRPRLYAAIERKFRRFHRRVPEENRRQAFVLEGARVLPNARGSAPGQLLRRGGRSLVLLPGPPWELQPMVRALLPALRAAHSRGVHFAAEVLRFTGLPESEADEKLAPVTARPGPGMAYTILAGPGQVELHATASAKTAAQARRRLACARRAVLSRLGGYFFGSGDSTLEGAAGEAVYKRRLTLAVAESCTGGLVSELLTRVPGSSRYFLGGTVAYDNRLKVEALGVAPALLVRHGAVSAPCARAMAEGALARHGASCALAVTGIAGPGGGTAAKPVGLTFIALARRGRRTRVLRLRFSGGRDQVRQRAAAAALALLLRGLR